MLEDPGAGAPLGGDGDSNIDMALFHDTVSFLFMVLHA